MLPVSCLLGFGMGGAGETVLLPITRRPGKLRRSLEKPSTQRLIFEVNGLGPH